jgi:hypothetical protein
MGLAAVAIYGGLVTTLGAEVIGYPSLTHYLREARLITSNPEATFSQLDIEPDDCDEALLLALNIELFASIGQLARLTHLPRTTVHRLYLNRNHELTWLRADEKLRELECHRVHSEKLMLTIVWNPHGFHGSMFFQSGSNATPVITLRY